MTPQARQWTIVGLVLLLVAGALFALVRLNPDVQGVGVGNHAPTYRVPLLGTSDTLTIPDSYRGHVTLVNIWATWCGPCKEEMPSIQAAFAALKDRGFRVAAVSIDEGPASEVEAYRRDLGLTFEILHDRSTRIGQRYQTTGVPESYLLDKRGTIIKRVIGAHDWNAPVERQLIERLLDE
ncbi:MAG TPA: TlpA disulfide reductase family protein [Gemmatimonadales bacterium]|nr:TlpA disulfide reductase family protein [Gemmatimonadales bacterium]